MNPERARDQFSAYREGELSGPIAEAFEAALASDPALRGEYRAFDEALRQLESLRDEPVPEPYMLHERIVSKVDRAVMSTARARRTWFSGWRLGLVGAVGAAAVLAAVLNLDRGGEQSLAGAGPALGGSALRWQAEGAGLRIVRGPGEGKLRIFEAGASTPAYEVELGPRRVEVPLVNRGDRAHLYLISDGSTTLRVAIPGKAGKPAAAGSGTVDDLAIALAAASGVPVEVQYPSYEESVEWTIPGGDPAEARISGAPVSVQSLQDGRVVVN